MCARVFFVLVFFASSVSAGTPVPAPVTPSGEAWKRFVIMNCVTTTAVLYNNILYLKTSSDGRVDEKVEVIFIDQKKFYQYHERAGKHSPPDDLYIREGSTWYHYDEEEMNDPTFAKKIEDLFSRELKTNTKAKRDSISCRHP